MWQGRDGIFPYGRVDRIVTVRRLHGEGIHARSLSRIFVSLQGHIIIVEPDDLIRELLARWLGEAGYCVVPAVKDHDKFMVKPQLVIADISDPGCAGATIEALRARYSAPIVALSALFRRGLGGSSEAAQRLNVRKVLPKPFTREELLDAVRETVAKP
jgi:DNA-binding response OmpR family regulator